MRVVFFDTETTGNGEIDRLCQLAVKEQGVTEPIVNALYRPPVPITIDAMAVHHITEKKLIGRPSFKDSQEYASLKELFEDNETIAIAHNAAFDVSMLSREGIMPARIICTYKVARALDPAEVLGRYQLQYLRYLLGLEIEAHAHDAWGDVLVLEGIYERLMQKMEKEKGAYAPALEAMFDISARPVMFTTIRFGKYKGKKIEEVALSDPKYLEWLLGEKKKEPIAEADWIFTLEHFLRQRA